MKAKHDKSIWQPQVEILLDLKKKLNDLKNNINTSEKKLPAKNKKAEPIHTPEQNGAALTDVMALEMAIAKQVFDIVKTEYFSFIIIMHSIYITLYRNFREILCEN